MRRLFLALAFVLLPSLCHADILACYEATCRIEAAGHSGTGCLFSVDDKSAYVLTNAHVAGGPGTPLRCVFIRDGHEQRVSGRTRWSVLDPIRGEMNRAFSPDCAVVAVPLEEFRGHVPKAIPLDPAARLSANEAVMSVGAAQGAHPTAWIGHVGEAFEWNVSFYPAPAGGRSGSAVFDKAGTRIVALIAWNGGGVGLAQQSHSVARAFELAFPNEVTPVCSGGGRGPTVTPTERVPLDELRPLQPTQPAPVQVAPNCPDLDAKLAELEKRILAAIEARVTSLAQPGPAGPMGPAGPQGPAGPAGSPGSVDLDALVAAVQAKLPKCPTADEIASKITLPASLTPEQIAALVRDELAKHKPDDVAQRPATAPGYYDLRRKK